jgi:glycosyltransferase involved in cell wall biosynthesis
MRYVVITPVRNEAEFIERTIQSMIAQSAKPTEWIIVNDGSTDKTAEIVAKYTAEQPWIRLVNRADRGIRQRGKGVIEAFYDGFNRLASHDYDIIVKLDGDLSFDPTYFEALLGEFASNPQLGIAGGGVYERLKGENWVLDASRDHVRGPTKLYRRTCFEAIGGLVASLGWDGVDEWKALMLGWEVRSFLKLKVFHYRYTGAATGGLKNRVELGYGAHYMGYHPFFIIARGIRHMFRRPYLIGGMTMITAYLLAWVRSQERLPDTSVIQYVRRTQLRQLLGLLGGKPIHK